MNLTRAKLRELGEIIGSVRDLTRERDRYRRALERVMDQDCKEGGCLCYTISRLALEDRKP